MSKTKHENKKRVLVIGWDAADWKIINPLLDAGYMPALNKLINDGVMGNIATLEPPLSPMLWTSIATGKRAYQHGILNFTEPDAATNFIKPVNVTSRKVKALWNILSQNNYKTHTVGWWPSHPAEPINGISVSNFYQRSVSNKNGVMKLVNECIHPKSLEHIFAELVIEPKEITPALILPFIPHAEKIDQEKDNALHAFARILSDASCVQAAATWILENNDWDFMAVYFDAIDHFSHRFMRYHPPKQEHIAQDQFDLYKHVVNGAYRFHDMMLERLLELAGEDCTVILLSDHGFHSDHLRPRFIPREPAGPAHEHRHHGIIVMSGDGIKKDERIYGTSLLDIAPTVLYLFDLPIGKDMEGRVIHSAFENPKHVSYIDSWENVEGNSGMHTEKKTTDPWAEQIALNQLIELGYVENPGEDKQKAVKTCVDESQFNLARTYMDGRKYEHAYQILKPLQADNPDAIRFCLSLVNCCTALNNFEEAQQLLNFLQYSKSAKHLNIKLLQGNLFFAEGKTRKALKSFLEASAEQNENHALHYSIGKCFMQLRKVEDAESKFLQALSIDENNATYHHALAQCYFSTKRYEECIVLCLSTIGLLFYFPNAHYLMGESLYQLHQYEQAAAAFNLFLTMVPTHAKARRRLNSLGFKDIIKFESNDKKYNSFEIGNSNESIDDVDVLTKKLIYQTEECITIVSGLPRSGTSMMMKMLQQGGLKLMIDDKRKADKHNEHGYFELNEVKNIARNKKWIEQCKGKVVKVIAQNLFHLPPRYVYRIVFMQRNLNEIIHSQQVMLGKADYGKSANYPIALVNAFQSTLTNVEKLKSEPHIDLIEISYNELLSNPDESILKLNQFFGGELSIEKMRLAIDDKSYRSRLL